MERAFFYEEMPEAGYSHPALVAYYSDYPHTMTVLSEDEDRVVNYLSEGGEISPYQAPEAPAAPPRVSSIIATAKLTITEGVVEGFSVDSAISGGLQIDTGKFWMFLSTPFDDADYIVNAFDGGLFRCYVQPDEYYPDSFIVTTTDLVGVPADPACISIIVMKAI